GIDTGPDGNARQKLAGGIVGDGHDRRALVAAAAAAEEAMMLAIDREPGRALARSHFPLPSDFHRLGVDLGDIPIVLEIDIKLPTAIADAELRPGAEVDVADDFASLRVDGRRVLRVAVEGEHALGRRVIQYRVGIELPFLASEH